MLQGKSQMSGGQSSSKHARGLDLYLANKRGQSIRVTLWGGLGDMLTEKITKHVGLCPVVLTSVNAKYYNSKSPWNIKPVGESSGSTNLETGVAPTSPLMKRLSKESLSRDPSVSTSLKPVEEKNKKRLEYEDSDTEIPNGDQPESEDRYIESDSEPGEETGSEKLDTAEEAK
ncbi:hypothetical protein OROHE_002395 [Orobanche hederae]